MTTTQPLSSAQKIMIGGLLTATTGVLIQIFSAVPYPKVPPVFFILLVPAALVAFGRWRWAAILVLLAGLFLILGVFSSGAYSRFFDPRNPGGMAGLWIQMLGVLMATLAALKSILQKSVR